MRLVGVPPSNCFTYDAGHRRLRPTAIAERARRTDSARCVCQLVVCAADGIKLIDQFVERTRRISDGCDFSVTRACALAGARTLERARPEVEFRFPEIDEEWIPVPRRSHAAQAITAFVDCCSSFFVDARHRRLSRPTPARS